MTEPSQIPPWPRHADAPFREAVRAARGPLVLAVSGGSDSMALLHAMARFAPERVATVATFDHGTGAHARQAARLVVRTARELGLPVTSGVAAAVANNEAGWRAMRWAFLREVAAAHGARVATAHTADDQLETIVQRALRDAGARGLAALAADGDVVRPWLHLERERVHAYLKAHAIPTVADPSNSDRRHQRVRVRLDVLPAFEAASPGFGEAMRALGERAAAWRREVDALAAAMPWREVRAGVWRLERPAVAGWSAEALHVVWPALLAPVAPPLSREGTDRLVRFTIGDARAGELLLPGGVTVVRQAGWLEVRGAEASRLQREARRARSQLVVAGERLSWPGWSIVPVSNAELREVSELHPRWAAFPLGAQLEVRGWQAGDRLVSARASAGRRISRYLSEAGVPRRDRLGWPVVLLGGQVVWVPGIVCGLAAPHRSGRSDLIWYRSDTEYR